MRLVLNITKQQLSAPLREFFIKVEKIEGTSPRLKLTDEEVKKYSRILKVTPAEFYNGMKLLTTGRSLLMAAEIMRQATVGHGEKKMNSMTAVVGMRHMVEIQKFLTKPALAMRYATILERNLTKIKGTEAILAELRRAKRIFSQAQKN